MGHGHDLDALSRAERSRQRAERSVRLEVALIQRTYNQIIEHADDAVYHRWQMHESNHGAAVLLLVATEDRKNRIVVGQALFREIPDQHATRILAMVFRPRARRWRRAHHTRDRRSPRR
jgi:uncharacterized membrane protein YgcG